MVHEKLQLFKRDLFNLNCIFKSCQLWAWTRGLGWRISTTQKYCKCSIEPWSWDFVFKMCQMRIVDKILHFGVQVWVQYMDIQPWGMGSRMSDYCRNTYPEPLDDHHSTFWRRNLSRLHPPRGQVHSDINFIIQKESCLMTLCKSTNNGNFQKESRLCTSASQRVHILLGAYLERTKVIIAAHLLTW